jgi:hypothetical protein
LLSDTCTKRRWVGAHAHSCACFVLLWCEARQQHAVAIHCNTCTMEAADVRELQRAEVHPGAAGLPHCTLRAAGPPCGGHSTCLCVFVPRHLFAVPAGARGVSGRGVLLGQHVGFWVLPCWSSSTLRPLTPLAHVWRFACLPLPLCLLLHPCAAWVCRESFACCCTASPCNGLLWGELSLGWQQQMHTAISNTAVPGHA